VTVYDWAIVLPGGRKVSELKPTELKNFDAADAFERRRLREMDEKFCERLAMAIEHGKERLPGATRSRLNRSL